MKEASEEQWKSRPSALSLRLLLAAAGGFVWYWGIVVFIMFRSSHYGTLGLFPSVVPLCAMLIGSLMFIRYLVDKGSLGKQVGVSLVFVLLVVIAAEAHFGYQDRLAKRAFGEPCAPAKTYVPRWHNSGSGVFCTDEGDWIGVD